ncbi:MAG: hypothetical protein KAS32_29325 [Candidatus Peribacteraceae bacterium]|nr:hypothetical protein [Candidatus Peribacteraceae bacterium]
MKKLLIVLILFLPCTVIAQGFDNVWPAWENFKQGETQDLNLHSSIVERAQIDSGGTGIVVFYKSAFDNLESFKDNVSLTSWLDRRGTNASGHFKFPSVSPSSNPAPWSVTGITEHINLPTNYYDYTPFKCLHGYGPFTNDTTVGHGYGWTNANTQIAGTNFPGSRTNWYTTDYGRDGMRTTMPHLVWTYRDQFTSLKWRSIEYKWTFTTNAGTWEDTKTGAENATPIITTNDNVVGAFAQGIRGGFSNYTATLVTRQTMVIVTNFPTTNISRSVDLYIAGEFPLDSAHIRQYDLQNFTDWTLELSNHIFVLNFPESDSLSQTSSPVGEITQPPNWCDEPVPFSNQQARGFGTAEFGVVLKWDGTNGLKYK